MKLVERSDSGSKKTRLTSYQSSFNKKKITLSQSDCPSLNWSNKIQYKWKANSGLGEAGEGQAVPGTITQNAARDFVT